MIAMIIISITLFGFIIFSSTLSRSKGVINHKPT